MTAKITSVIALGILIGATMFAQSSAPTAGEERIAREVRHEILTLPYYGVFDSISYKVDGYKVTLGGKVTRTTLKSGAEQVVKKIEGVEQVDNQIDVLPPLSTDDALRIAVYRAIYGHPSLQRYAFNSIAPIRIVVENGKVELDGVVNTKLDRQLAVTQAAQIPGVIGQITDNLQVEQDSAK